jgi:hypothetical protein
VLGRSIGVRSGIASSLPLANLTAVGCSEALKALNMAVLPVRRRYARKMPKPIPRREPTVACVLTVPAAFCRASRSDCLKLYYGSVLRIQLAVGSTHSCCICCSAKAARSGPKDLRNIAMESVDIVPVFCCSLANSRCCGCLVGECERTLVEKAAIDCVVASLLDVDGNLSGPGRCLLLVYAW